MKFYGILLKFSNSTSFSVKGIIFPKKPLYRVFPFVLFRLKCQAELYFSKEAISFVMFYISYFILSSCFFFNQPLLESVALVEDFAVENVTDLVSFFSKYSIDRDNAFDR